MNNCHTCRFFALLDIKKTMYTREYVAERQNWCAKVGVSCMEARGAPSLVKVLDEELDLPLFALNDGQCGLDGKLWEAA